MKKKILLGQVGVDSGQLMICDPSYITSQFKDIETENDHGHPVFRHKDGSLWQFVYGAPSIIPDCTSFPGSYETVIPKYGKTPNQLIADKDFEPANIDNTPHIPLGEFSYRGICKVTGLHNQGGQLNYALGHEGVAVAFRSGFGDGTYNVFAEYYDAGEFGERIKKVTIELIDKKQLDRFKKIVKQQIYESDNNR